MGTVKNEFDDFTWRGALVFCGFGLGYALAVALFVHFVLPH